MSAVVVELADYRPRVPAVRAEIEHLAAGRGYTRAEIAGAMPGLLERFDAVFVERTHAAHELAMVASTGTRELGRLLPLLAGAAATIAHRALLADVDATFAPRDAQPDA